MSKYTLKIKKSAVHDDGQLTGGVFCDGTFLDAVNGYTEDDLLIAARIVMHNDVALNSDDGKTIELN